MRVLRRVVVAAAVVLLGLFIVIQAVPYGRDHANPPVQAEPAWDSTQTRALAARACFDCHSNETAWPWYTQIAPVSWLAQRDVDEGRAKLNFSEFNRPKDEPGEAAKAVREGEMPPWYYTVAHPDARLSPAEKEALIRGLEATLGRGGQEEEEGHGSGQ